MNVSTHPNRQELADYLLGTLPEDRAERLEEHLQTCRACKDAVRGMERLSDPLIDGLRRSRLKDTVRLDSAGSREHAAGSGAGTCAASGGERHSDSPLQAPCSLPSQLGEYEILEKLGEGGMGAVYKARHRFMKRLVAVKIIGGTALKSPQAAERFRREVEATAKVEHPNIVAAYDAGEHQGVHYLVMQFVDGKDLNTIVKERGPLPVDQAVDYILQAAHGLQYAHEQGVIHRDIKPGNMLLDSKGAVKILDMGLARIARRAGLEDIDSLTSSDQVMGTLDYMAPKQALDSHHADARADIYSLGCSLYRLLTGKAPFKRETVEDIIRAHRARPDPIPSHTQAAGAGQVGCRVSENGGDEARRALPIHGRSDCRPGLQSGNGDTTNLPERPGGCCAQIGGVPVSALRPAPVYFSPELKFVWIKPSNGDCSTLSAWKNSGMTVNRLSAESYLSGRSRGSWRPPALLARIARRPVRWDKQAGPLAGLRSRLARSFPAARRGSWQPPALLARIARQTAGRDKQTGGRRSRFVRSFPAGTSRIVATAGSPSPQCSPDCGAG